MIIQGRAYDDYYLDVIPILSNGRYKLIMGFIHSPVFPEFIEADFSSYEGFQSFISNNGITTLTYLDKGSGHKFPLVEELKKIQMREYKEWFLSKDYIQKFYDRNKECLQEDQDAVKLFHKWFFKGNAPIIKNTGSKILNLYSIYYNGNRLRNTEDDNNYQNLILLDRSLNKHISYINHYLNIQSSGAFGLIRDCKTLPAHCYLEMIELTEDKKELKQCAHCGKLFASHHEKEIYCDRPINKALLNDYQKIKGYTSIGTGNTIQCLPGHYKSCKNAGAQKRYIESKSPEEKELIRQKKQFQNRLLYLKEIGNDVEYKKVLREFSKWQKEGSHGKAKRKG